MQERIAGLTCAQQSSATHPRLRGPAPSHWTCVRPQHGRPADQHQRAAALHSEGGGVSSRRLSASSLCTMRLRVRCGRMPVCSSTQARPTSGMQPAKNLPSFQPSAARPNILCGSATGPCQQNNKASQSWALRWDPMPLCAISSDSTPNASPRTACCKSSCAFRICRRHCCCRCCCCRRRRRCCCCCCCCSFAQRLAPTTFSGLCRLTSPMSMLQCTMRPSHCRPCSRG